ncbi:MAG TPA: BPSS1780 family membrane protein [Usitatibacter sp.]|nr:BPSS1780 family membrane protein [Usitatibacter sp.]
MDTAAAPQAAPLDPGLQLVLPGRSVTFGQALSWIPRSWTLFKKAPLMWILSLLILMVGNVVLQLVPVIGAIAVNLLQPVYMAGFAVACRSLETGGEFELEQILAGFKTRSTDLLIIGALLLLGMLVIVAVFGALFVALIGWAALSGLVDAVISNDPQRAADLVQGMWLPTLLAFLTAMLLVVPLMAAYWFAPYLTLMHAVKPVAAMKESLMACVRNFFQMFVYGLGMLVVGLVVALPAIIPILGWIFTMCAYLVLAMMSIAAIYTSYRDIFTEEVSRPAAATVTL